MKMLCLALICWGLAAFCPVTAALLQNIDVDNGAKHATFTLTFDDKPVYSYFSLSKPERLVIDIRQRQRLKPSDERFSADYLLKRIRTSKAKNDQSQRLVVDLHAQVKFSSVLQTRGKQYQLVFTLKKNVDSTASVTKKRTISSTSPSLLVGKQPQAERPIVVAIDPGHGGQDPGATGSGGLKEKNVTLVIARKLAGFLQQDPLFTPVLTREGDYYVSVMGRSDVARQKRASVLVSIHADAAPQKSVRGVSVWVLSNRRANNELGNWLEQHEKQSELLGGAGSVLANAGSDIYLSQTVLDLQFGHSQRVGYEIANKVLHELGRVSFVHRKRPEHASLGVLRSPDIPSLLVETGFISNADQEQQLASDDYQNKVARAIYLGLRSYFHSHPSQFTPMQENPSALAARRPASPISPSETLSTASYRVTDDSLSVHKVTIGETLGGIAQNYGTTIQALRDLNKLKKEGVWIGQRLKVPAARSKPSSSLPADQHATKRVSSASQAHNMQSVPSPVKLQKHKVVMGDSLSVIAQKYNVTLEAIKSVNHLKSDVAPLGRVLIIPRNE
jgi:N-acetylmuramoyl-L-alanine amidase